MKARNYERVEKLFQRCLMKVLNIDLWKTYLHYVKDTKGSLPSFRFKLLLYFPYHPCISTLLSYPVFGYNKHSNQCVAKLKSLVLLRPTVAYMQLMLQFSFPFIHFRFYTVANSAYLIGI